MMGILAILACGMAITSASPQGPSVSGAATRSASRFPTFVGFSYARAASANQPLGKGGSRFVHLTREILNINANFIPQFSSFEATVPGIYSFSFSFLTATNQGAIVALRRNSVTVISGLSEKVGHNPSFQSTLIQLKVGDVVQLEVMEGEVFETQHLDYSYTSFSGYLVQPQSEFDFRPPRRRGDQISRDFEDDRCCCSRVCPADPIEPPPYQPPSHYPPYPSYEPSPYQPSAPAQIPTYKPSRPPYQPSAPTYRPNYPTTPRPPFIVTTQPPYSRPPLASVGPPAPPPQPTRPSIIIGRTDRAISACCKSLLVSANAANEAFDLQNEKFGVYRFQYLRPNDGRSVYKHCENDQYLFYHDQEDWSGWLIGPNEGVNIGGLLVRSDDVCVESTGAERKWLYYDKTTFVPDKSIAVSCFSEGYLEGEKRDHAHHSIGRDSGRSNSGDLSDGTSGDVDVHYHHHQHYYKEDDDHSSAGAAGIRSTRKLPIGQGPSYQVKADPEWIEATFVFPTEDQLQARRARRQSRMLNLAKNSTNVTAEQVSPGTRLPATAAEVMRKLKLSSRKEKTHEKTFEASLDEMFKRNSTNELGAKES